MQPAPMQSDFELAQMSNPPASKKGKCCSLFALSLLITADFLWITLLVLCIKLVQAGGKSGESHV